MNNNDDTDSSMIIMEQELVENDYVLLTTCNNNGTNNTSNNNEECHSDSNNLIVGAYYYPWYNNNYKSKHAAETFEGFHGRKYLRHDLIPPQYPLLGEYDDTKSNIIHKHIKWCIYSGINLWVTSWWGKDSNTDRTIKNYILKHKDLSISNIKIALFYETQGRIKTTKDKQTGKLIFDLSNVYNDLSYIAETYFHDTKNYFTIDKRPVLYVYVTRWLTEHNMLNDVISLMRNGAKSKGYDNIYIIGDEIFSNIQHSPRRIKHDKGIVPPQKHKHKQQSSSTSLSLSSSSRRRGRDNNDGHDSNDNNDNNLCYEPYQLKLLDGITNYDVYGCMVGNGTKDGYAKQSNIDRYYEIQKYWKDLVTRYNNNNTSSMEDNTNTHHQCTFIPSISPGFNDKSVRDSGHYPLSRKLDHNKPFGSLFESLLINAIRLLFDDDDDNGENNGEEEGTCTVSSTTNSTARSACSKNNISSSVVDKKKKIIMITSWNEWHEDTQIEPVKRNNNKKTSRSNPPPPTTTTTIKSTTCSNEKSSTSSFDDDHHHIGSDDKNKNKNNITNNNVTRKPYEKTNNLQYNAYGKLYLNILRKHILPLHKNNIQAGKGRYT